LRLKLHAIAGQVQTQELILLPCDCRRHPPSIVILPPIQRQKEQKSISWCALP
jgi:hypothetical protein